MAYSLGIMGHPNTGKSHSRSYLKDGRDCFVISPSQKFSHLFYNDVSLPAFELVSSSGASWSEIAKSQNTDKNGTISMLSQLPKLPETIICKGNSALVQNLNYLLSYLMFIDKHMPHIKNVFIADFTHFMSNVIATSQFKSRKSGGEAFQRWWDLAADTLNNVFKVIEYLERKDLLVIVEFHVQIPDKVQDNNETYYDIFVPGGNMLNNAFKPKSYFDIMLCSTVLPYEDDMNDEDRFKFVVTKKEPFDGRGMGLFNDIADKGMIPNNMQIVLDRVRKRYNI